MTGKPKKNYRDLVAGVCDQQLDRGELEHLNDLLKSDPIAQQEWLDHLFIDALLQYELGGKINPAWSSERSTDDSSAEKFEPRRLNGHVRIFASLVLLLLASLSIWWFRADSTGEIQLQMSNSSFENFTTVSYLPTMTGWYGDTAHVVTSVMDIVPVDGERMLRLVRTVSEPQDSCEVYQVVDLRHLRRLFLLNDTVFVEASAAVNSLAADESSPYLFTMHLYGLPDNPLEQKSLWPVAWRTDISFVGKQLLADSDHQTWQRIQSTIPLHADTNFLLVQISVRNENHQDGTDYPGQFVDHVQISLKN